jgi:hypothetical protein
MFMHSFTTHLQEVAKDHPFRKNQSTFDESQKSGNMLTHYNQFLEGFTII